MRTRSIFSFSVPRFTRETRNKVLGLVCSATFLMVVPSALAQKSKVSSPAKSTVLKTPRMAQIPAEAEPMPSDPTTPVFEVAPTPAPPPTAQAYVTSTPPAKVSHGHTMVPLSFFSNGLGASSGRVENFYRIVYFGHTVDVYPYQTGARFNDQQTRLPVEPQNINGSLYVPWTPIAELFGIRWKVLTPDSPEDAARKTTFLLQYPAAYIENVRTTVAQDKVRVVMELSNPTRVVATQKKQDAGFQLAAARREGVPSVEHIQDYLVARTVLHSGDWQANFHVRINYSAPVQWFTLGNPTRLVVDVQRLFEERKSDRIGGGLALTKIRRGTKDGPVQMYVVRIDPQEGWRVRVAPGGYSVLQRNRPSRLAARNKALVAVNGGFFSYDGAAVGAVLVNGEWIRLPWKGRTAVGFWPDGKARIGNLQVQAVASFSNGLKIPIRDLNGWPDSNKVTALTRRFGHYYKLRPGEMALEVKDGIVVGKPGGGGAAVHANGFTLIASGGARPWLNKVLRGTGAVLSVQAPAWRGMSSALGGGPRLVNNSRVEVTALREDFRTDVRIGRGPRTAFGIDSAGRYIIVVVDGRQKFHSVGLTLTELAYTMQKFGAKHALNLDGGGSTVMAIKNRIVNRPSDGSERRVSNALLVMR
jgi:exopolysaccharide biosynthesis protein